jgi:hypothetical protein
MLGTAAIWPEAVAYRTARIKVKHEPSNTSSYRFRGHRASFASSPFCGRPGANDRFFAHACRRVIRSAARRFLLPASAARRGSAYDKCGRTAPTSTPPRFTIGPSTPKPSLPKPNAGDSPKWRGDVRLFRKVECLPVSHGMRNDGDAKE